MSKEHHPPQVPWTCCYCQWVHKRQPSPDHPVSCWQASAASLLEGHAGSWGAKFYWWTLALGDTACNPCCVIYTVLPLKREKNQNVFHSFIALDSYFPISMFATRKKVLQDTAELQRDGASERLINLMVLKGQIWPWFICSWTNQLMLFNKKYKINLSLL